MSSIEAGLRSWTFIIIILLSYRPNQLSECIFDNLSKLPAIARSDHAKRDCGQEEYGWDCYALSQPLKPQQKEIFAIDIWCT